MTPENTNRIHVSAIKNKLNVIPTTSNFTDETQDYFYMLHMLCRELETEASLAWRQRWALLLHVRLFCLATSLSRPVWRRQRRS